MCNRTFSHKAGLRRHLESHPLAPENAIALAAPSPMPVDVSQPTGESTLHALHIAPWAVEGSTSP